MVRPPCCDKMNLKRALWTAEEDAKMLAYVSKHGTGNWTTVPRKAGLKRCGKSCRLRWTNYLRPDLKHDGFTPQEEELIIRLHAAIGSRWSIIAQQLPGRTDNDVKNYWNTKLKKKLTGMGIDPVTHRPFSQLLADYGNIGVFFKAGGTRIGSLSRDLKSAIRMNAEQSPVPPVGYSEHEKGLFSTQKAMPRKGESDDQSLDLLAELQAFTLVKEASKCPNQLGFLNESDSVSPPSSSSSSTCSTATKAKSAAGFPWQDFLLEDTFQQAGSAEEQAKKIEFVSNSTSDQMTIEVNNAMEQQDSFIDRVGKIDYAVHHNNSLPTSDSCNSSFVKAILDQDSEMFMEFPDIFEEPFYY